MNNTALERTLQKVRNQKDIKLMTTDKKKKRSKSMSELTFRTRKCFSGKLLVTETKTMNLKMNKPVYIGLSIFEISNVAMCDYWLDYVKPRYGTTSKLCYMDINSLIINVKS